MRSPDEETEKAPALKVSPTESLSHFSAKARRSQTWCSRYKPMHSLFILNLDLFIKLMLERAPGYD